MRPGSHQDSGAASAGSRSAPSGPSPARPSAVATSRSRVSRPFRSVREAKPSRRSPCQRSE
ncbi:hypothetical protein D9598_01795 [Roseomonas sp. KE0001]|nr:hypothetical protein [Roseomonas sp. KE0001]